jgi:hypothetical protein
MSVADSHAFSLFSKLKEYGIIYSEQNCDNDKCKKKGQPMQLSFRKRQKEAEKAILTWRCSSGCYKSIFVDSFFSMYKKPMGILLALIKCWAAQLTITKTKTIIELNFNDSINVNTIGNLFSKLRMICTLSVDKKNYKMGGPGKIVELDESLYVKVKHSKGSIVFKQ